MAAGDGLAFLLPGGLVCPQFTVGSLPRYPDENYHKLFGQSVSARDVDGTDPDPPNLLREIEAFIAAHVHLPGEMPALTSAVWVVQTHYFDLGSINALPYLHVRGPYGSGKTRFLEVLGSVCWRGLHTAGRTSAALFRTAEAWKPTRLDEFVGRQQGSEALTAILNTRYRRELTVIRFRPRTHEPDAFDVFGPTAFAGRLPGRSLVTGSFGVTMAKTVKSLPRQIDYEWSHS